MKSVDTILVVEDEDLLREQMVFLLKSEGFLVFDAGSVADAKKVLSDDHDIQLVVTDINLPDAHSLQLLEWQRETNKGRYIPFIMITGNLSSFDEGRAKKMGVVDFLPKPFDLDFLLEAIAANLASDNYIKEVA